MGEHTCSLSVSLENSTYVIGDEIVFSFELRTSTESSVRLFDNALCSIDFFSRNRGFQEESKVYCKSGFLSLAAKDDPPVDRDSTIRKVFRDASSSLVRIGPQAPFNIHATAVIGQDKNNPDIIMFWFDDDVYFSIESLDQIEFFMRTDPGYFDSEVGRFGPDQHLEVTRRGDVVDLKFVDVLSSQVLRRIGSSAE